MYGAIENLDKAESNYVEALNLFDKTKNKAETGYIYGSLGAIYLTRKNEEKSRNYQPNQY